MPDQQRQEAESEKQEAEHAARESDFQTADEERLIRIRRVAESPDESRQHDREETRAKDFLEERDGERTRRELLR